MTSSPRTSTRKRAPPQQSTEEQYETIFKKGTIVEASSEDEGLRGSWYTATILRTLSRKTHKLLIEYHNLFADEAGSTPLREFVDAILLRPIPPREPMTRGFTVMEDVDAFHNDGWWEGVVTRVVEEEECGGRFKYSVFFRCSREEIEFFANDLRLHREWVPPCSWVPTLEKHSPSSGQKRKNGEDRGEGRGGGGREQAAENGEVKDVWSKDGSSPSKRGRDMTKNGRGREGNRSKNRSVSNGVVGRKKQRVISSNGGLTRQGKLKEPRRRAANHGGRQRSRS